MKDRFFQLVVNYVLPILMVGIVMLSIGLYLLTHERLFPSFNE